MMKRSSGTVESFRELIAIPLEIEEGLAHYAYKHPEDSFGIERLIDHGSLSVAAVTTCQMTSLARAAS
jgi:hypothetical protein